MVPVGPGPRLQMRVETCDRRQPVDQKPGEVSLVAVTMMGRAPAEVCARILANHQMWRLVVAVAEVPPRWAFLVAL